MAALANVPDEVRGTVLGLNVTSASFGWLGAAAHGGWMMAGNGFAGFGPLAAAIGLPPRRQAWRWVVGGVAVLALIFTGYPVAFSLGGTSLIFAAIWSKCSFSIFFIQPFQYGQQQSAPRLRRRLTPGFHGR
jgi:hypothetical protein